MGLRLTGPLPHSGPCCQLLPRSDGHGLSVTPVKTAPSLCCPSPSTQQEGPPSLPRNNNHGRLGTGAKPSHMAAVSRACGGPAGCPFRLMLGGQCRMAL